MRLFVLICLFTVVLPLQVAKADDVLVACASNFIGTLKVLKQDFEAGQEHRIKIAGGSTGKLYSQIINGAPYDIFLAANAREPGSLVERGFADEKHLTTYAKGALVLATRAESSRVDSEWQKILLSAGTKRMAIANPKIAPYGHAAQQVLDKLFGNQKPRMQIVHAENIAQTFSYLLLGNVDFAMVSRVQANEAKAKIDIIVWDIPQTEYDVIEQQGVLLRQAEHKSGAQLFFEYIQSKRAQDIIAAAGYKTVP